MHSNINFKLATLGICGFKAKSIWKVCLETRRELTFRWIRMPYVQAQMFIYVLVELGRYFNKKVGIPTVQFVLIVCRLVVILV